MDDGPGTDRVEEIESVPHTCTGFPMPAFIAMNCVHHRHSDSLLNDLHRFIFAFHDSTFECLAGEYEISLLHGSINGAVSHMATLADEW
ncbi:MAG: hypothetical protein AB8B50_13650 [Pirellulaceae bacterium]